MVEETEKIWTDGKFIDWKDAKVHVLSHALHYGSAVFEGIRSYKTGKGSAIFRLKDHVDRLFNSAHIFGMKIPFSKHEFSEAIKKTVKINKLSDCYIRPVAFLGYGPMGLNPVNSPVKCSIAAWNWGAYLGEKGMKDGIRLKTSTFTRHHVNVSMTKTKISGNYSNSVMAKREAVTQGFDEALMLDTEGYVAECTGENIFIVKNNVVYTPSSNSILPGITRSSSITILKDLGFNVMEDKLSRDDIYVADECFLTGTAAEITPVREVDNRMIGIGMPGPVTNKLRKIYSDAVRGKISKYRKWNEYV